MARLEDCLQFVEGISELLALHLRHRRGGRFAVINQDERSTRTSDLTRDAGCSNGWALFNELAAADVKGDAAIATVVTVGLHVPKPRHIADGFEHPCGHGFRTVEAGGNNQDLFFWIVE